MAFFSQKSANIPAQQQNLLSGEQKAAAFWSFLEFIFLLLVCYLPFQLALNLGPDIDLASGRILILGLFLVWLAGSLLTKRPFFISTFQGFGLIAFLIVSGLSLVIAQEFGWGFRKFLFFLSIFPLCFITASLYSQPARIKKLIDVLLSVAIIAALVGLVQFLSQFLFSSATIVGFFSKNIGPLFWGQSFSSLVFEYPSWFVNIGGRTLLRAFGLFPDPHMMAFFLGLILPISFSFYLLGRKRKLKLLAVCFLLFVVLLLTFSRGGYLGILAAIGVILFLTRRFLAERKKLLILIGFVLALLILFVFAQPVLGRFLSAFSFSENSSLNRLQIWQDSWQVFLSHPILGVGLGNYSREIDPLTSYRSPITSHNLYLDILSESGLFGLAVWLFLILGTLYQLLKTVKKTVTIKTDNIFPALGIGLIGSLCYFIVHSFFETSVFNPVISAFLMIILGLASAVIYHGRPA